ncbi:MAG: hypothetical protein K2L54_01620, partial [Clostridiales bacterium]|nr:hypothetical protein [Clostridiales bacterium]
MLNEFTFKSKDEWRSELIARRLEITDKPARSERATRRVLPLLKGNVLVYVSMSSELCTRGLIKSLLANNAVTVYAPYTIDGEIMPRRVVSVSEPDKWGNMPSDCYAAEPCEKERDRSINIDYCITPLLGFNCDGYRIGYG